MSYSVCFSIGIVGAAADGAIGAITFSSAITNSFSFSSISSIAFSSSNPWDDNERVIDGYCKLKSQVVIFRTDLVWVVLQRKGEEGSKGPECLLPLMSLPCKALKLPTMILTNENWDELPFTFQKNRWWLITSWTLTNALEWSTIWQNYKQSWQIHLSAGKIIIDNPDKNICQFELRLIPVLTAQPASLAWSNSKWW